MKRTLYAAVAAIILIGSTAVLAKPDAPPIDIRALIDTVSPSIVMVTTARKDAEGHPGTYVCTGVVVSSLMKQVLTAKHCVESEGRMLPALADNLPTTLVKADDDLALLAVPDLDKPRLDTRKTRVAIGDLTYAFGFGYGLPTVLMRPIVWIVNYHQTVDQEDLVVDGPFVQGMSGGPVVDANGKLIGIVQKANDVLGFASGPGAIKAFLK